VVADSGVDFLPICFFFVPLVYFDVFFCPAITLKITKQERSEKSPRNEKKKKNQEETNVQKIHFIKPHDRQPIKAASATYPETRPKYDNDQQTPGVGCYLRKTPQ
jgi:hypothetical protein